MLPHTILPSLTAAAQYMQANCMDYWPERLEGMPSNICLYNFFDEGVWLVDDKGSVSMGEAVKLLRIV